MHDNSFGSADAFSASHKMLISTFNIAVVC